MFGNCTNWRNNYQTTSKHAIRKPHHNRLWWVSSLITPEYNHYFSNKVPLVRQPTFPASFYTQSASPQRSSSTSGYNGSLPGSVSPSSNPYAQAFPNQAVTQLYQQAAAQNSFSHHHTTTSPLATTNNGTTTSTEWPYSQYQQAFGHQSNPYQSTNTTAQTSAAPTSSIHSAHHYNQLAVNYPFSQQQEQHHRTPAFATG